MSILDIDFESTPNQHVVPSTGIYVARFEEAPVVKPGKKDPSSTNVEVTLKIVSDLSGDEKFKDEQIMTWNSSKSKDFSINIKRLFMAAGIAPYKGISLDELKGKTVQVSVVQELYTPEGGEARMQCRVKEIMVPAEMLKA